MTNIQIFFYTYFSADKFHCPQFHLISHNGISYSYTTPLTPLHHLRIFILKYGVILTLITIRFNPTC